MWIDDVLDHIGNRVTASTLAGLGGGAAYASYKGFPIVKTSASTAFSFALVSTACFVMERVANSILQRSSILLYDEYKTADAGIIFHDGDIASSATSSPSAHPKVHYASHALGGMFGGGVVGFLFQGKPIAGALLLTPIMLGIGKLELSIDEYRNERLRQLLVEDNNQD